MATQSLIRLALLGDDGGPIPPVSVTYVRRRAGRWAERLLMAFGVFCLGYFLYATVEARLYQSFEDRELNEILNSASPAVTVRHAVDAAAVPPRTIPVGSTIGRIEIPQLGVSAVIRAGSDARTLRLAVGYVPGTALPGQYGNVGLAGHRDTFFRKLRDINPDDEIRIVTTEGVFHYYVQHTKIVMPRDVWVLDPTDYPALTLVTCYPFTYIGSAPKRFVVRAALGTRAAVAGSSVSQPAQTTATLQRERSVVRTALRVPNTRHSNISKRSRITAKLPPKRSKTRATRGTRKSPARPSVSRPARTTAKPQTIK